MHVLCGTWHFSIPDSHWCSCLEFSRKFLEQSEKRTLVSLVNLVNFYFSSQSQQLTSYKHLQFKVGLVVVSDLSGQLASFPGWLSLSPPLVSDFQALPTTQFLQQEFTSTSLSRTQRRRTYRGASTTCLRQTQKPRQIHKEQRFFRYRFWRTFRSQSTKLDEASLYILKPLPTDF